MEIINHKIEPVLNNSRVCLAGRFNARKGLCYKDLDGSSKWKRRKMSKKEYEEMKSHYYPSLLRSMIEIDDEEEQSVCRYEMTISKYDSNHLMVLKNEAGSIINYPCSIKNIIIWIFPFDIFLFSIEIEDHTDSFEDLRLMHVKWKNWFNNYYDTYNVSGELKNMGFRTDELDNLLEPLTNLTEEKNPAKLTIEGTKIRQYQLIESNMLSDELLYELGSFSPVGVVAKKDPKASFKPSNDYFAKTIVDNSLSVFSNWKALALNDSFTILAIDDFFRKNEFQENFELLYMRCLFEEFYCFDRNNLYRGGANIDSEKIEGEIAYMERHYFFDDMSYDFLPPLMYGAMAKGLSLQKDYDQLTQHVKQSLAEARQERNNNAVNFVQIFAAFSVIWTIREVFIKIWPCFKGPVSAAVFGGVALLITILLLKCPQYFIWLFQNSKKNI